ncbi:MAG TPA: WYL domain-containing protein [Candidatus Nanopelagicaceae bacterium]
MSDQKTERLINLTMALLATKRFMSKAEIFNQVAGYSGTTETKERMFERDKDDLRTLGISIEVGTHDPLFDDELGYRILENGYELEIGELSPTQISYLSLAATIWRNQLFTSSGSHALVKIDALNGTGFREDFGQATLSLENETPLFPALWEAITNSYRISFTYRSSSTTRRQMLPYGLSLWHGSWYLVGYDLDKEEIRVFKVSRIISEITVESKAHSFSLPTEFTIEDHLVMLAPEPRINYVARARVGRCQSLRMNAQISNIDAEWDRISFTLGSDWLEQILWFGYDLVLESPLEKVEEITSVLREKL